MPQMALKVSNKTLKFILYLTGNQCKLIKMGIVMVINGWNFDNFLEKLGKSAASAKASKSSCVGELNKTTINKF